MPDHGIGRDFPVKMKEGIGWKACYNEQKGFYGAEFMFQESWNLYEISGSVFNSLSKNMGSTEAEQLIMTGRCLYTHVNDRCGPPYTIVLDDDYADYCPKSFLQACCRKDLGQRTDRCCG